jgi:hypothetical protein
MLWWCTWFPSVTTPLVNVKSSWWMNEDEQFASNSTSTNIILRLLLNKLCPARAQCTHHMSSILVMHSQLPSLITHLFAQPLSLLFFDSHGNSMRILLVCKLCTASSKDLRLLLAQRQYRVRFRLFSNYKSQDNLSAWINNILRQNCERKCFEV